MITQLEQQEDLGYEVFDGCYGTVTATCKKGAFLTLDNGEDAYAYQFANLRPGTQVQCTVRKMPAEGRRKLVTIDSVCWLHGYV